MLWLKKFSTVDDIPQNQFDQHKRIFARVEDVVDGCTIRVRHVPGFSIGRTTPSTAILGPLENETLLVRLFGVDIPDKSETVATKAKATLHDMVYHQMVELTLGSKISEKKTSSGDESGDDESFLSVAIASVDTVELKVLGKRHGKPKDIAVTLARMGLVQVAPTINVYKDDGERREAIEQAVDHAKQKHKGLWKEVHTGKPSI